MAFEEKGFSGVKLSKRMVFEKRALEKKKGLWKEGPLKRKAFQEIRHLSKTLSWINEIVILFLISSNDDDMVDGIPSMHHSCMQAAPSQADYELQEILKELRFITDQVNILYSYIVLNCYCLHLAVAIVWYQPIETFY